LNRTTNNATLGKKRALVAEDVVLNQFLAKPIMGFEVTVEEKPCRHWKKMISTWY
jgi:hypothetical protein